MTRINCRYIAVQLNCSEDTKKLETHILDEDMNAIKIIEHNIFVYSKQNGSTIRYKKGIHTLKKRINLVSLPKRIFPPVQKGDVLGFIVKSYSDLFYNNIGICTYGHWSITYCVQRYLNEQNIAKLNIIKANNNVIAKEGALGAIRRNLMDYCTALRQEQAYKQISQEVGLEEYNGKDVPYGDCILARFAPYGRFPNTDEGKCEAEKYSKTVKINSHLGEGVKEGLKIQRKKHYVIYSKSSAWGKSTFADMLVQKYNAQRITQVDNFIGIRENVQFLVLDEYSGGFSDDQLKKITGGNASSFAGNRKSFGRDWIPRPDLQLIFLMNECLFAYHGKYNPKTQTKIIDGSLRDTFGERFIHIKLDSCPYHDENIDLLRFSLPSTFSNEEQIKYIAYLYNKYFILQRRKRIESINFCCGDDHVILSDVQYNAYEEDILDKKRFLSKVCKKFSKNSKAMLKVYMIGLQKYIKESLQIEFFDSDLTDLHFIIDTTIDDKQCI